MWICLQDTGIGLRIISQKFYFSPGQICERVVNSIDESRWVNLTFIFSTKQIFFNPFEIHRE